MKVGKRSPSHPGGILRRQYIEPLKLTVADLTRVLGVSRKTVAKIVHERGPVSADMALRLSQAFGTTPELWLNLQQNYDLWHAAKASRGWKRVEPFAA
jgi:addiction module HigA family antidote